MNMFRKIGATPLAIATVGTLLIVPSAFCQGSLTPPGSPTPTMKTLDQIEPRTPISSVPFTITNPGSYYLTTNVIMSGDPITIATNGVTLDLQGFTISSTAPFAFGTAIFLMDRVRDVTIYNGHILSGVTNDGSGNFGGSGFAYGISGGNNLANCRVSGVSVTGCSQEGIDLGFGNSTVVESCTVTVAGSLGIGASVVKGCTASGCGDNGIDADQATDCYGDCCTFDGSGIRASSAQNCIGFATGSSGQAIFVNTALNCSGTCSGTSGTGISADTAENCWCENNGSAAVGLSASTAKNCHALFFSNAGILVPDGGTITGCSVFRGGISAGDGCTIKDCSVNQCTNGISTGAGCIVQGCIVSGNSLYGIVAGTNSAIIDCIAKNNSADGIRVTNYCQVIGNSCLNNGAPADATKAGIHIVGSNCRVEDNHTVGNKFRGILIDATGHRNVVIKNTSKDNIGADFDLAGAGDNDYGQIVATPGPNFVNSNPWANIAF